MAPVSFKIEKDCELSCTVGQPVVAFILTASASGKILGVGRFRFEELAQILGEMNVVDPQLLADAIDEIEPPLSFAPVSTTLTDLKSTAFCHSVLRCRPYNP